MPEGIPTPLNLGIWLKKDAHGQKYGKEALQILIQWARKHLDSGYYLYPVDKNNHPSRKLAESLGGKIAGKAKQKTASGDMLDEVLYKLTGTTQKGHK